MRGSSGVLPSGRPRYVQLESELMRQSDELRSAMVSAVATIAGQQEQLQDMRSWAASAVKALQVRTQPPTTTDTIFLFARWRAVNLS